MYYRPNALSAYGARNGSRCVDVQNYDWKLVLSAQSDRCLIHHAKLLEHDVAIADLIEERCVRIQLRICRIYSVDARRLDDYL
jgi:hypothetical protein